MPGAFEAVFDAVAAALGSGAPPTDPAPLVQLVAELRPRDADDATQAQRNLLALVHLLDQDAARADTLRRWVTALVASRNQTPLFTEVGILPSTGFFGELLRRLGERVLPAAPADTSGVGLLSTVFHQRDDHVWVRAIDDAHWVALFRRLGLDFDGPAAPPHRAVGDTLDALDVLAVRIASLGTEPELIRLRPELDRHDSPFIAFAAEVRRHLDACRAVLGSDTPPAEDARHSLVLLDQCAQVLARVRRNTHQTGIAVGLTYAMARLDDLIARTRALLVLLDRAPGVDRAAAFVQLFKDLVEADNTRNDLRGHFARNTDLLAREITEHSGRTGEHYITADRAEYRAMFRAAAGAGAIVPLMAFAKLGLYGLHAAPLIEGLLYGLNYAAGFVLIQLLHFTLATKQPAMTATRIAAALHTRPRQTPDLAELTELVVRVCRSQFVAILGNVAVALPLALFVALAVQQAGGVPVVRPDKAVKMLHDLHPWQSLALLHAAIAGVWLFVAGIVSGYWDNKAVYRRIPDRVRRMPGLRRVIGDVRAHQLGDWIEHNLGGFAGNVFFGLMLGLTGAVGFNLGLPLDIRHVTFAAANLGIAGVALEDTITPAAVGVAALGVTLVGVVNVVVSFTLALLLAMKARRVRFRHALPLLTLLARRFARRPLDFFRPPRDAAPTLTEDSRP